jgi:hypothetical protein
MGVLFMALMDIFLEFIADGLEKKIDRIISKRLDPNDIENYD